MSYVVPKLQDRLSLDLTWAASRRRTEHQARTGKPTTGLSISFSQLPGPLSLLLAAVPGARLSHWEAHWLWLPLGGASHQGAAVVRPQEGEDRPFRPSHTCPLCLQHPLRTDLFSSLPPLWTPA